MLRPVQFDGWTEVVSGLDAEEVDALPTHQRNEALGVALLTQVQVWFPDSAKRIVDRLLDAATDEVLAVLNDPTSLFGECKKALRVIKEEGENRVVQQWLPASTLRGGDPMLCPAKAKRGSGYKSGPRAQSAPLPKDVECKNSFEALCGDNVPAASAVFPVDDRRRTFGLSRAEFVANHNSAQCRQICEDRATEVLSWYREHGGVPTTHELEFVMEMWDGRKNHYRKRVNPKGQSFVRSMSLGLIARHTGECGVSVATTEFPMVTRFLNYFMEQRAPDGFRGPLSRSIMLSHLQGTVIPATKALRTS